uniref:Secreted protein n=1 Tax=Heterorhabditis bacteriophora TaxID=37862 RepID=A0A1I7XAM8_HETBA
MQASFVEGTNLVMVWISQDKASDNCYDETQCPKTEPSEHSTYAIRELSC